MKKILKWLLLTNYGRLITAIFFTIFFQILSNIFEYEIFDWFGLIFLSYLIIFTLYVIIYVWIIN